MRSPEILAPARMPVAAGKNIEKTLKKFCPSENWGGKFSLKVSPGRDSKDLINFYPESDDYTGRIYDFRNTAF